jgi:hypothetical protein
MSLKISNFFNFKFQNEKHQIMKHPSFTAFGGFGWQRKFQAPSTKHQAPNTNNQ